MGYHRAGFTVVGVDVNPQPDYPFEFVQADALEYLEQYGHLYDVVHASPPCQSSSALTKGREYVDLIPDTRAALARHGGKTIMENVQGSDLRRDVLLCGEMFGLQVIRHRYFEVENFTPAQPEHIAHRGRVKGYRHGVTYAHLPNAQNFKAYTYDKAEMVRMVEQGSTIAHVASIYGCSAKHVANCFVELRDMTIREYKRQLKANR